MQGNTTISVVKSVATEAYDAPAIVYELICGADAPMSVRLREPIPTGFEAVDLGFHQEHHADEWWVGDDEIVFEYPFEPGETVTTVVGVRTSAPDDLDSFLSEPTIEVATTDHDGESIVMGVRHREHPIEAVQFHPESVLTPAGHDLIGNFLASV